MTVSDPVQSIRGFEERLRRRLAGFSPNAILNELGERFRRIEADRQLMAQNPPHFLALLWEASCAYFQPSSERISTSREFDEALQMIKDFDDPVLGHQIQSDSDLLGFMLLIDRQQFQMQYQAGVLNVGRAARMGSLLSQAGASEGFAPIIGLPYSQAQVVLFCLFAFLAVNGREAGLLVSELRDSLVAMGVAPQGFDNLLHRCAKSPYAFGETYKAQLDRSPRTWRHNLPQFVNHPLVISKGRLASPAPQLIVRWLSEQAILRAVEEGSPELQDSLSSAWEKYVGQLLEHHFGVANVMRPDVQLPGEEAADYLVRVGDSLLVVECKLTALRTNLATENAVLGSGAMSHVVKGIRQTLSTTAHAYEGRLGPEVTDVRRDKVARIVATFGRVPAANSTSVWERRILPDLAAQDWTAHDCEGQGALRPQVLEVAELELLVVLCRLRNESPSSVIKSKIANNVTLNSDWGMYLLNATSAPALDPRWSFWREASTRLLDEIHALVRSQQVVRPWCTNSPNPLAASIRRR